MRSGGRGCRLPDGAGGTPPPVRVDWAGSSPSWDTQTNRSDAMARSIWCGTAIRDIFAEKQVLRAYGAQDDRPARSQDIGREVHMTPNKDDLDRRGGLEVVAGGGGPAPPRGGGPPAPPRRGGGAGAAG